MGIVAWIIARLFSSQDKPDGKPYRLGLLFVHGMGEQARGDTITEMGDALTEWLRRWIGKRGDFKIREATVRPEMSTSAGPSSHVSVVLTDERGVSQEWLLAESWWAGAFRQATFRELATWAASVGPWLIASQVSGIQRRMWGARIDRWWKWLLAFIATPVIILLAAVVAAVVTPLAFILLLVSMVPVPIVSDMARGLAHNLAGSFGDLLVLVRSPVRFAAMAERVRDDIARLDSQCDSVMVVAHSQGSAVAWQAIKRAAQQECTRPPVALFVSFGQAMRKLKSLYRVNDIGGSMQTRFSLLAFVSSVLLVVILVTGVLALAEVLGEDGRVLDAIGNGDWYWMALLAAAAGVVVVQWILQAMAAANDSASEVHLLEEIRAVREAIPDFRWVDLWGSADPAPNGPLLADPTPDVQEYVASYKVRNMGSTALDHSVYWSNVTEFVSAIAYLASGLAWPNATGVRALVGLREAISLRDRRVNMLAVARVIFLAGTGFAIFGAGNSLASWGSNIREFVRDLPLTPDEWFPLWLDPVEGLLAAAVIGAGAVLVWLGLLALWSGPIRSDTNGFFKRTPFRSSTLWPLLWFVAALALPVAAVSWAAVNVVDPGDVGLYLAAATILTFVASLAVVSVLTAGGIRLYEDPSPTD